MEITIKHLEPSETKTLTLGSVARSRQSVDPWRTTQLSSSAPGSPVARGQTEADAFMQHMGHKWPGAALKEGEVPNGKNTFKSGINLVPAGMKTGLSQTSVTTPNRLCHWKGQSSFHQQASHFFILSYWSFLNKYFPQKICINIIEISGKNTLTNKSENQSLCR